MPRGPHRRTLAALYVVGLLGYGAVAGPRLAQQSSDPHFVYQADAWLRGRLAIEDPPPARGDDWCRLTGAVLGDGTEIRGRRMATRSAFQTTDGREIPLDQISRYTGTTHYVSFPPAPALLMLPGAALAGRAANDVIPTVLLAALVGPLFFACLVRLREAGHIDRSDRDNLWLTFGFCFGTVFFFAAVQGRVWYTAHVTGVAALLAYVLCAVDARRPALAGVFLGLAALARVPMAFAAPLLVFEAWRACGGDRGALLRRLAWFAVPLAGLAAVAMLLNASRFDDPLEFGHRYLAVRQQANMEQHGLFSWSYLGRNLQVALALLPEIGGSPAVRVSGHGLAIWITTPLLLGLLARRPRGAISLGLAVAAVAVAAPTLLYQNTGWFQFGYRFALDYLPLLFLLVAASSLRLGPLARVAIALAVAINLFGAITFARYPRFYRTDADAYRRFATSVTQPDVSSLQPS